MNNKTIKKKVQEKTVNAISHYGNVNLRDDEMYEIAIRKPFILCNP
jgi:hypothetical protein